jgi:hypothetical protein
MGLTEALAAEQRPQGVHVTLVNPGSIDTDSFRRDFRAAPSLAHRLALRPERVARAVVRAVERDCVEVSVPVCSVSPSGFATSRPASSDGSSREPYLTRPGVGLSTRTYGIHVPVVRVEDKSGTVVLARHRLSQ